MNIFIYTLGCRLNQAESEAIADAFRKAGFTVVGERDEHDIVIVNTCTVTSKAEQKARRMIRLFSKSSEAVVITGCYAELAHDQLASISDNVVVFSLKEKASLLELPLHVKSAVDSGLSTHDAVLSFCHRERSVFDFDASSFSYHSRAYLKIQDGCDNRCGYCRTTIARGPSVFLDPDEAVSRALRLEHLGFHEIMLTGVNLTNYNHRGEGLGGLLEKMLAALGDDVRIRLSSMEPDHVDDRLLDAIRDPRMQPHFHIPIQTASEKVLGIVNRHYSIDHVSYIIDKLRACKDDPFIACDIIAGLPGEDEDDFMKSYDFIAQHRFSALHVFPYSPRPNTSLYGSPLKVEERVRDERAERLRKLSAELNAEYVARQLGKDVEILAEGRDASEGTTGNYLKARILNISGRTLSEGGLYKGTITSVTPLEVSV